jgi:hypothetical protein
MSMAQVAWHTVGAKAAHGPRARRNPAGAARGAGLPGFYKGMRTKIVQSILAAALLMAIKEQISKTSHVILANAATVLPAAPAPADAGVPEEVVSPAPADI